MTDRQTLLNDGWILVDFIEGNFKLQVPTGGRQIAVEEWRPAEDFLFSIQQSVLMFDSSQGALKGFFLTNPMSVPFKTFSLVREFMFAFGIPTRSLNMQTVGVAFVDSIVDLLNREVTILQKHYVGGPLDGVPIDKYGWFDERHLLWEKSGNRYALYTKRTVDHSAEVRFLGEIDSVPVVYFPILIDLVRSRRWKDDLNSIWNSISAPVPGRVPLVTIKNDQVYTFCVLPGVREGYTNLVEEAANGIDVLDEGGRRAKQGMRFIEGGKFSS